MAVVGSRRDESYGGPYLSRIGPKLEKRGTCFYCQAGIGPGHPLVYWSGGAVVTDCTEDEPAEVPYPEEWRLAGFEDGCAPPPREVYPGHIIVEHGIIVLHPHCVMDWFVRLAKDVREIAAAER